MQCKFLCQFLLDFKFILKYSDIMAADPFNVIAFFVACAVAIIYLMEQ